MAWSEGLKDTLYTVEYKEDFGNWQDAEVKFNSEYDARTYANSQWYHFRIFKVSRECMKISPKYNS